MSVWKTVWENSSENSCNVLNTRENNRVQKYLQKKIQLRVSFDQHDYCASCSHINKILDLLLVSSASSWSDEN